MFRIPENEENDVYLEFPQLIRDCNPVSLAKVRLHPKTNPQRGDSTGCAGEYQPTHLLLQLLPNCSYLFRASSSNFLSFSCKVKQYKILLHLMRTRYCKSATSQVLDSFSPDLRGVLHTSKHEGERRRNRISLAICHHGCKCPCRQ